MSTTATTRHKVTLRPGDAVVEVPEGTLLVDAAAQAGVQVDVPCGGQGRCGRCQVKLAEGEVTHRENPHLTREQIEAGWVLSCVARVAGDLVVEVPPRAERERAARESAASRKARAIEPDWPPLPVVRHLYVEMDEPTLDDATPDVERLRRGLSQSHNLDNVQVPLPILQTMGATLRDAGWKVTAVVATDETGTSGEVIDLKGGRPRGPALAVAVDIGTTTVVAYLVDLRSGRLVGDAGDFNRQIAFGEDVISRIIYTQRGDNLSVLQREVVATINQLIEELAEAHRFDPRGVHEMVVAGNTTMLHLFLGVPGNSLRVEPYVPVASHLPTVKAGELGLNINPSAPVHCLSTVAAYVGADVAAGVLAAGLYKTDKLTLFLDVGTNGELVMGNSEWMMTCACSAGPAFEGAGVQHGMRAVPGAIENVSIHSQTLEPTFSVIGDVPPRGICGSGMIALLAEMFITGVVTRSGRINVDFVRDRMPAERCRVRRGEHGAEYVVAWGEETESGEDIVLTDVDIDNLVRAKAAVYAGMAVMAEKVGLSLSDVEEVLIGGAFGQHINIEQSIQIGLLPDLPWDRFKYLGNTSALGAYNALISRHARQKVDEIASQMTYLELIADNTFMNEFTSASFLPHTELDRFPSVKALLEEQQVPAS